MRVPVHWEEGVLRRDEGARRGRADVPASRMDPGLLVATALFLLAVVWAVRRAARTWDGTPHRSSAGWAGDSGSSGGWGGGGWGGGSDCGGGDGGGGGGGGC